jgi:hypothetical protein
VRPLWLALNRPLHGDRAGGRGPSSAGESGCDFGGLSPRLALDDGIDTPRAVDGISVMSAFNVRCRSISSVARAYVRSDAAEHPNHLRHGLHHEPCRRAAMAAAAALTHGVLERISALPAPSCRAAIAAPALGSAKPGNPTPAPTCWSLLASGSYPGFWRPIRKACWQASTLGSYRNLGPTTAQAIR